MVQEALDLMSCLTFCANLAQEMVGMANTITRTGSTATILKLNQIPVRSCPAVLSHNDHMLYPGNA